MLNFSTLLHDIKIEKQKDRMNSVENDSRYSSERERQRNRERGRVQEGEGQSKREKQSGARSQDPEIMIGAKIRHLTN